MQLNLIIIDIEYFEQTERASVRKKQVFSLTSHHLGFPWPGKCSCVKSEDFIAKD